MAQDGKITLYALDCGTVNWRLYRMEYHYDGAKAQHVTSPLSSPLANFSDRKLPAVLTLTPDGTDLEDIGETALNFLEDTENPGQGLLPTLYRKSPDRKSIPSSTALQPL